MDDKPRSPIETLGEKLRSAREKKNLSIEQIQKETKIHSTVLRAIEEGRCDDILTPTYVHSFLKKYSQYLGLDTRDILKEYSSIHKKDASISTVIKTVEDVDRSNMIRKAILSAVAFIMIIFALLTVKFVWGKAVAFFSKVRIEHKTPARSGDKRVTSKTSHSKRKTVEIPLKSAVQKKEENIKGASSVSAKQEAALDSTKIKPGPFKMTIKVNQDVMVKVKKDGTALFGRVLPKNSSETVTANDKIELYIAKGEAVEIIIDGKSFGSPGRGILKNIEVTGRGFKLK